jgi:hypothetical protein
LVKTFGLGGGGSGEARCTASISDIFQSMLPSHCTSSTSVTLPA